MQHAAAQSLPRKSLVLLAAVLGGGVLVSLGSWGLTREHDRAATRVRYEQRLDEMLVDIRKRMFDYEQLLRAGAGLFAASNGRVNRAQWQAFVGSMRLEDNYPGVQGFGYARTVAPAELHDHVASVRREGFPDYTVRPAGPRAHYTAIVLLEPFYGRNLRAFGYDMYSEPVRRSAMERARDTGLPALTGKVKLVQESQKLVQAGTLIYVPVYRAGLPVNSAAERRAALQGWVYCPFRMTDLMVAVLGARVNDMLFELYDGDRPQAEALLYAARTEVAAVIPNYRHTFDETRTIEVAGERWTMRFATLPEFDAAQPPSKAHLMLFGGLTGTALLAILVASLMTNRTRALAMAERMSRAYQESENRVRTVLERTAEGIITTDMEGIILSANPAAERLFGYDAAQMVGRNMKLLMPERLHATHDAHFARFAGAPEGATAMFRRDVVGRHASGGEIPIRTAVSVMMVGDERQFITMLSDISEQRRAEAMARAASLLNETILANAPFSVIATDTAGLIKSINSAGEQLLGYSPDELVGRVTPAIMHSPDEVAARAHELTAELGTAIEPGFEVFVAKARRGIVEEREWTCVRKDGSRVPVNLAVSALKDANGEISGFLAIAYDVTERKRAEENIRHLAQHDALTGLPNRMLLHERARFAIEAARRAGAMAGVLLLDLDHFKHINDSLGHHVGDEVLRQVAQRLTDCVRPTDTVARMGGDEFVILLSGLNQPGDAARVAEKTIAALEPELVAADHRLHATPSIGIAIYPADGTDLSALLKNADAAMYRAKAGGRKGFRAFTADMREHSEQRLALETDLHRALDRGEFELHYQPVVALAAGHAVGVEALLRWRHPERGNVSPAEFIPLAEETGLIVPIGEWVLRRACAEARQLQEQTGSELYLAVNLSPRQLKQANLLQVVMESLADARLPAHCLELEITERAFLRDTGENIAVLTRLRKLGVHIAVDDFGTGFASLSYLTRFPASKLKVDRSFVQNMTVEPGSAAVVGAVIAMAQSLDLDVVAEGVETSEQRDFLHDRQCHQAQGFYFSRPVPMAEIPRLLAVIGAQGRSPDDPKPGEGGSAADGKRTLLVAIGKS